ncbi:unnamed protein product [Protopolystoma xenopodis]|uniref:Uncharacterized protein n=1 Tax=Protopolystoma xenopodis TaxID=117903 RepID=A0A3S5BWN6_9PLAT|nr:unnamed protein product [Protopolystoma xenopodis]
MSLQAVCSTPRPLNPVCRNSPCLRSSPPSLYRPEKYTAWARPSVRPSYQPPRNTGRPLAATARQFRARLGQFSPNFSPSVPSQPHSIPSRPVPSHPLLSRLADRRERATRNAIKPLLPATTSAGPHRSRVHCLIRGDFWSPGHGCHSTTTRG